MPDSQSSPSMSSVVISGATGLVGRRLVAHFTDQDVRVRRLLRRRPEPGSDDIAWNPATGKIDADSLDGCDAVIHLAGKSIAASRWTNHCKEAIRDSRLTGTRLLCSTLADLKTKPKVLISASAIGFYGNGDTLRTEQSPAGNDFLAHLCRAWEEATQPAQDAGIRVVHLRTGIVLSKEGGALAKMLMPFKMCMGGIIGSGKQMMSWISLHDLVRVVAFAIAKAALAGPINAVAPVPVTNREFTKTLGSVLGRPTFMPLPAPVVQLLFGEMGKSLLLEGVPVQSAVLNQHGFVFEYTSLEQALRFELSRP